MKLNITLQVLQEVSDTFPEMTDFINEKLEQKCANENISLEEVIQFFIVALLLH